MAASGKKCFETNVEFPSFFPKDVLTPLAKHLKSKSIKSRCSTDDRIACLQSSQITTISDIPIGVFLAFRMDKIC